jgi:hypothetical protein
VVRFISRMCFLPIYEGVAVHRPGVAYESSNVTQEPPAEPHLPGFRVPVAETFAM